MDSSVFPVRHDRYGIPGARPEIHRLDTPRRPAVGVPHVGGAAGGDEVAGGRGRLLPALPDRLDDPLAAANQPRCTAARSYSTSTRGNSIPNNRGCGLALGCPEPGIISIWPLRKRSWTSC